MVRINRCTESCDQGQDDPSHRFRAKTTQSPRTGSAPYLYFLIGASALPIGLFERIPIVIEFLAWGSIDRRTR